MGPSSMRPLCYQSSRHAPYVGCMGPSVVVGLTTVGLLVDGADPGQVGCQALPRVLAVSLLVGRPRSWHGCLQGPGVPGLVPICWWAWLGPGVADCLALGFPGQVVALWWAGKHHPPTNRL